MYSKLIVSKQIIEMGENTLGSSTNAKYFQSIYSAKTKCTIALVAPNLFKLPMRVVAQCNCNTHSSSHISAPNASFLVAPNVDHVTKVMAPSMSPTIVAPPTTHQCTPHMVKPTRSITILKQIGSDHHQRNLLKCSHLGLHCKLCRVFKEKI